MGQRPREEATRAESALRRFWQKVRRLGPDECWPWLACKTPGGYGDWKPNEEDLHTTAHRAAWIYLVGPVPSGWLVAHRCGRKDCCNPAHMRLARKVGGRHRSISPETASAIRRLTAEGVSYRAIASRLGVSRWAITRYGNS